MSETQEKAQGMDSVQRLNAASRIVDLCKDLGASTDDVAMILASVAAAALHPTRYEVSIKHNF